ncbi:MAG TPA: phosphoribosyltransferase family protein [Candidatus Obscuribacterales bacterium]
MLFGFGGLRKQGESISEEDLQKLLTMQPRRHRLIDPSWHNLPWTALQAPVGDKTDYSLSFPFFETFCPAFDEFCHARGNAPAIERLPFERQNGDRVSYTYLKNATNDQLNEIGEWVGCISQFVGIRDSLRVSFALDYTCECGDPQRGLTQIAQLRQLAKLYGGSDSPSTETLSAAAQLAEACINFVKTSKSYYRVNSVLATPRSDPSKEYSLPGFIADRIARDLGLDNLSAAIRTVKARREMKETPADERLNELKDTIAVDQEAVKGKRILIVDDLYQSGTTMNYVGKLLLDNGASCVYGLACEKTCSNQD